MYVYPVSYTHLVHGDQYAVVRIKVPADLSPEAKAKLKEFQNIYQNDQKKRRGSAA